MEHGSVEETKKQLESLSKVFGGGEDESQSSTGILDGISGMGSLGGEDMAEKIAMAKKLSFMLNEKEEQNKKVPNIMPIKTTGNRQLDMLTAALPFIEPGFQKPLSAMINFMEIRNIMSRGMPLQIQSIQTYADPTERRKQLINAIIPYMDQQDQQKINSIMKVMEMSKIMNFMGGNE